MDPTSAAQTGRPTLPVTRTEEILRQRGWEATFIPITMAFFLGINHIFPDAFFFNLFATAAVAGVFMAWLNNKPPRFMAELILFLIVWPRHFDHRCADRASAFVDGDPPLGGAADSWEEVP